jgi:hypothetical protein
LPAVIQFEQLAAFALNELDAVEAQAVRTALAASPADAATVERIRLLAATVAEGELQAPPRALVQRVRALLQPAAAPVDIGAWLDRFGQAIASLVFDSRRGAALAGFRSSTAPGTGYQLAFSCDAADVDLQINPPHASGVSEWSVRGQIGTASGPAQATLALLRPEDRHVVAVGTTDPHGMLLLNAPAGSFEAVVKVGETLVRLGVIDIA